MTNILLSPNSLILTLLTICLLSLATVFLSKETSILRNVSLLVTSAAFLLNILIIDYLFLNHLLATLVFFQIGNYIFALQFEPLGMIFLNLLGILWICSLMYSIGYLNVNKIPNSSRFIFFLNLCILVGVLIAFSANLFTLFTSYELLTLVTIPLISHNGNKLVEEGLYKYLKILVGSSMLLFFPAIVMVYMKVGHGEFIRGGILSYYFSKQEAIILLLMFIFGISKAALYPVCGWLPSAMVANYPTSAILHAVVVVKSGLFCMYKILVYVFGLEYLQHLFQGFNWLTLIPIFTMLYCLVKAIKINNIKMLLAYSTISQLSVALMSAFMFTPKAIAASVLHVLAHAFTKISLFYAAGNIYSIKKTNNIYELIGINKQMPITCIVLLLSFFSLIGIPPFAGFISKFYILKAASHAGRIEVIVAIILSSIFSALYLGKVILYIYQMPRHKVKANLELKLPKLIIVSLVLCNIPVIFFIVFQKFANHFLNFI